MEGGTRILLLSFGLMGLISYVNSVKIYGRNPNEDVEKKLDELQAENNRLTELLSHPSSSTQKRMIEKDLQNVNDWIRHYLKTSSVSYKDYVEMMNGLRKHYDSEWSKQTESFEKEKAGLKMQYEKEMEDLRELLREAEYRLQRAAGGIAAMEQKDQQIAACTDELQALSKERDTLKTGLAAETESFYQQQEMMLEETNRLKQDKEELTQKLKQAQYLNELHDQQEEKMVIETNQLKQDKEELTQKLKQAQYLTELQNQQQDKMLEENGNLKQEKEELVQKLKQAQYLTDLQNKQQATMQEEIGNLKQEKEELSQKLKREKYQTDLQREQLEMMLEETNKLKEQKEKLSEKLRKAQELTELQRQEQEKMQEEMNKLKQKKEEMLQKLKQMQELTELQNKRQKTMQEEMDQLKQQKEKLSEKLKQTQELTELMNQQQEILKNEKKQLMTENGEMFLKLKKAQDFHSKALEVVAISTQQCPKPVRIPHKDEIDAMRKDIRTFVSKSNYKQILTGLPVRQGKLEGLLFKLHDESKLSTETALEVLEEALDQMEIKTLRSRDEQDRRRQDLLQSMKTKALVDYENEDMVSMQKAIQSLVESNGSLQELARLKAYLRAIWTVVDLMKELVRDCSNALQYSKYQPMVAGPQ